MVHRPHSSTKYRNCVFTTTHNHSLYTVSSNKAYMLLTKKRTKMPCKTDCSLLEIDPGWQGIESSVQKDGGNSCRCQRAKVPKIPTLFRNCFGTTIVNADGPLPNPRPRTVHIYRIIIDRCCSEKP